MPLFETISVDIDSLRPLVDKHWGVEIGDVIKMSQNHTYMAKNENGERVILRITPDPKKVRRDSTDLEVKFLEYLNDRKLPVCVPIKSKVTNEAMLVVDNNILCLFTYATGEPVVYTEWKWLAKEIVVGVGKWFGLLHKYSQEFSKQHPELVAKARHWKTLHDSILAEVVVDERDNATVGDAQHYGLIHGDVNPSNYFWDASLGMPSMFDWDQMQSCWLLYDLSAPIWGVYVLEKRGNNGEPVPSAVVENYTNWLLEGYEPTLGTTVDRDALKRMVGIRRELYLRFCTRAVTEMEDKTSPMAVFCQSMVDFFSNPNN
ncbi:hypothetical protein CYY_001147 [Polysphondylium violaceum]|uniref:Aminoglycoside phosphotransferase domain-containing protein n=1 Tax=Polysphondylium violaceum TaxID=133409 RepID=A0A8J4Q3P1_9MYCE|nr:hypothetical protein CYY_001147 [Polysphondylium violaceum]